MTTADRAFHFTMPDLLSACPRNDRKLSAYNIHCIYSMLDKFISKIFLPHMLIDENIYAKK